MRTSWTLLILGLLLFWGSMTMAGEYGPSYDERHKDLRTGEGPWQQPVALTWLPSAQQLAVALRESGELVLVDPSVGELGATDASIGAVKQRLSLGGKLTALAVVPNTGLCLVTDDAQHAVHLCQVQGEKAQQVSELKVSPYPCNVLVGAKQDGEILAYVASLWSRQLSVLKVGINPPSLTLVKKIDLPFAPRAMTEFIEDKQLVVGDAFSGQLVTILLPSGELGQTRNFLAHNLRGFAVSADRQKLVITHQMLNDAAQTTRTDVHWGLVMSNDLRWLKKEQVFKPGNSQDLYFGSHMQPLGEPGRGAADPAGITVTDQGTVVVALTGVNEIAVGKEDDLALFRIGVGKLPRSVALSGDQKQAYVANFGDDTITCVSLESREVVRTIGLGPKPKFTQVQQGEVLFNDAKLSHDSWMTCASCHVDGHTSNQLNDNLSDRSFGAAKRVLSLLGVKDTLPLAWNGEAPTIPHQVASSIERTMQSPEEAQGDDVSAIAAYLESLLVPAPVNRLRGTEDTAAIARGKEVFTKQNCAKCHAGDSFTTPEKYDVGLVDSAGNRKFNPPSLRGLSHRSPYFHDNSAGQLKDVFLSAGHPGNSTYSEEEVRDLIHYLESL
ncbi:MAG: cytochrome c peroxidase [Planctomycetaceae bacterium]